MILVASTYWGKIPFWFTRPPEHARADVVALRTDDFRVIRGLAWSPAAGPPPTTWFVVMHPRVDFSHHYTVPGLVAAGFGVLAMASRHVGNDTMAEHEEMLLDVAAAVRHARDRRGAERLILLGNSGGGSLLTFYQAQAALAPDRRLTTSPGGAPTRFEGARMPEADALVLLAAHRGQGKVLLDCIDPSVTDEADLRSCDPSLDMYDPDNGFCPPPAWSTYTPQLVTRYRAAQRARVERLDARAREIVASHGEASRACDAPGFGDLPERERRDLLRARASEPVMVVYRTMANLAYVDRTIEPSDRAYGSLLSDRPDLMNYAALGFARTVTARAWLSTWSGLSSRADLVENARGVRVPSLVVHAGADREVYRGRDAEAAHAALASEDKELVVIEGARHYFEPPPGEKTSPDVDRAVDVIVRWAKERA